MSKWIKTLLWFWTKVTLESRCAIQSVQQETCLSVFIHRFAFICLYFLALLVLLLLNNSGRFLWSWTKLKALAAAHYVEIRVGQYICSNHKDFFFFFFFFFCRKILWFPDSQTLICYMHNYSSWLWFIGGFRPLFMFTYSTIMLLHICKWLL